MAVMIPVRQALAHDVVAPLRQTNRRIFARHDFLCLAGVAMILVGAWFIYTGQYAPPLWVTWIVGPILWYLGVAMTVVWVCWRLFREKPAKKTGGSSRHHWRD